MSGWSESPLITVSTVLAPLLPGDPLLLPPARVLFSCAIRTCSRKLYLFLNVFLHLSHWIFGWLVCWVRTCLQRFAVVMTSLQNWHLVHLLFTLELLELVLSAESARKTTELRILIFFLFWKLKTTTTKLKKGGKLKKKIKSSTNKTMETSSWHFR